MVEFKKYYQIHKYLMDPTVQIFFLKVYIMIIESPNPEIYFRFYNPKCI